MTKKFTIVIPFAGNKNEIDLAKRSLPVLLSLNPDELLIMVDDPPPENVSDLREICNNASFDKYRIELVDKNGWNMQLCHVLYEGLKRASHDTICFMGIDELVNPVLLEGKDIVGQNNIVAQCAMGKMFYRGLRDRIVYRNYEKNIRNATEPLTAFTGVFWVHRPFLLEIIDPVQFAKVYNGTDAFISEAIIKSKYHYVTSKKFSHQMLDIDHSLIPWRQFQIGIWDYAHGRHANPRRLKLLKNKPREIVYSIMYGIPFHRKGWIWASKNPDHAIVKSASNATSGAWSYFGKKITEDIFTSFAK